MPMIEMVRLTTLALCAATATAMPAVDAFWAGANLPWNSFGYDIGHNNFDKVWFDKALSELKDAGSNSVRFWLHADGRATPSFAADGSVTGPGGPSTLPDLPQLVDLTQQHEVVLQICLWSFDMCKQDIAGAAMHSDLISDAAKTQSYVDHALVPMLAVLRNASNVVIEVRHELEHG